MKLTHALLLAPLVLLAACTKDSAAADGSKPAVPASAPKPAADAPVHALACGCALEEVGHCGEFVEVDGAFVPLELPVDLGSMPFCKKDGLKGRVEGAMKDGTFVATAFEYAD